MELSSKKLQRAKCSFSSICFSGLKNVLLISWLFFSSLSRSRSGTRRVNSQTHTEDIPTVADPMAGQGGEWPKLKSDWPLKRPCPVNTLLLLTNNSNKNYYKSYFQPEVSWWMADLGFSKHIQCVALLKAIELTVNKEWLTCAPHWIRNCVLLLDI